MKPHSSTWCPKTELIPQHRYRTVISKQPLNWAPLRKIINGASALNPVNHLFLFQSLPSDSNLSSANRLHLFNDLIQPRFYKTLLWTFRPSLTLRRGYRLPRGPRYGLCVCNVLYHRSPGFGLAKGNAGYPRLLSLHVHQWWTIPWSQYRCLCPLILQMSAKIASLSPTHPPTRAAERHFLLIHLTELLLTKV